MTTQPPAGDVEAREAALKEAINAYNIGATHNAKNFRDPVAFQAAINHAIDRYLAKLTSTKAEPSRIADPRVEKITAMQTFCDTKYPEQICKCASSDCGECNTRYLLSHITAIEAERDKFETGWKQAFDIGIRHQDRIEALQAENAALQSDKDRMREALERARTYVELTCAEESGEEAAEAKHDLSLIDAALKSSKPGEG